MSNLERETAAHTPTASEGSKVRTVKAQGAPDSAIADGRRKDSETKEPADWESPAASPRSVGNSRLEVDSVGNILRSQSVDSGDAGSLHRESSWADVRNDRAFDEDVRITNAPGETILTIIPAQANLAPPIRRLGATVTIIIPARVRRCCANHVRRARRHSAYA